ncbi:telomerase Cajal body protein 1-like [Crassostrea virginica]
MEMSKDDTNRETGSRKNEIIVDNQPKTIEQQSDQHSVTESVVDNNTPAEPTKTECMKEHGSITDILETEDGCSDDTKPANDSDCVKDVMTTSVISSTISESVSFNNAISTVSETYKASKLEFNVGIKQETSEEIMDISEVDREIVSGSQQHQLTVDNSEKTSESQHFLIQTPTLLTQVEFGPNNYLRGCKWSVDGSKILTTTDDNKFHVYDYSQQGAEQSLFPELKPSVVIQETGAVYDYCWCNQTSDSSSTLALTTSKDNPIHNWDTTTGRLVASYRAYNAMDELTAAYSLCYSLDGSKIYSGFKKMIRVFDTNRPGRECQSRPTFAGKVGGQSGIISCLAPSPEGRVYAAGSYSRSIGLYYEPQGEPVFVFEGQQGGVTHIAFSPDGTKLYSGGRKDPEILCWDLRNPGQIMFVAVRKVETNQRIYFDVDSTGQYLLSGNHDGCVTVYDTQQSPVQTRPDTDFVLNSCQKFQTHNDTVNGISLHPTLPVLATSSGQRHCWPLDDEDLDNDSKFCQENSLKLWLCK